MRLSADVNKNHAATPFCVGGLDAEHNTCTNDAVLLENKNNISNGSCKMRTGDHKTRTSRLPRQKSLLMYQIHSLHGKDARSYADTTDNAFGGEITVDHAN